MSLARAALEVNCDGCGHRTVVGALSFWGCVAFCERCEPWELDAYNRTCALVDELVQAGLLRRYTPPRVVTVSAADIAPLLLSTTTVR